MFYLKTCINGDEYVHDVHEEVKKNANALILYKVPLYHDSKGTLIRIVNIRILITVLLL